MRWRWLLIGLAVGCGGKVDTAPTGTEFTNQTTLRSEAYDTCDRIVYWPEWMFPILSDGLAPVAPPYEITEVHADLMHAGGLSCNATVGLELVFWVGSDPPDTYGDATTAPEFPILGRATISAESPETTDVFVDAMAVLDPPVRVEESGTLWIASRAAATDPPAACLAGCEFAGSHTYQWIDDGNGWVDRQDSLPLFQVVVRY